MKRRRRVPPNVEIDLHTVALSRADVLKLPAPHRHFLVNASLAVNDINAFCKLLILYGDSSAKNATVFTAAVMHYFGLTRVLSSKLVEFIKLVDGYAKRCERIPNPSSYEAATIAACRAFADKATGGPAYLKWRDLRNAVINHYVLDDPRIERNIGRFDENHRFAIVIHKAGGNTFFPVGEDIGFRAELGDFDTEAQANAAVEELMDWCIATSRLAQEFQAERVVLMLEEYLPGLGHKTETAYVEEKFVIREGSRPPGLFFLREKAPKRR